MEDVFLRAYAPPRFALWSCVIMEAIGVLSIPFIVPGPQYLVKVLLSELAFIWGSRG